MLCNKQCLAPCPTTTVTIQPPPFTVAIPGPSLYCPDQPMCIQQYNPCVQQCGVGGGRYTALPFEGFARPSSLKNINSKPTFERCYGCDTYY